MKKLRFNEGFVGILAIMLGILQFIFGYEDFKVICLSHGFKYKVYDFYSYMFIGNQFGKVCYLDKKNLELLLMPLAFLVFGMFIAGWNFMAKPKEYHQFVYSRVDSESCFVRKLFVESCNIIACYVVCYFSIIAVLGMMFVHRYDAMAKILIAFIFGIISRIIFLLMIKSILLFIYLRNGLTQTILLGICVVGIVFMINIDVENSLCNLILFSNMPNILGIVIMMAATYVFNIINKKIDIVKI